jgi:choline dehydrogenase-like flavoprotein
LSILDARHLDRDAEIRTGICIVGAGAAGITIAAELDALPLDVCLLESGGLEPDAVTQDLYSLESVGYPVRENFMSRARYYGGSCNVWAGRSMRLGQRDVEGRDWVPGSAWPIPHHEIAAHYPRAARLLRLPALERFDRAGYDGALSDSERSLFADDELVPTISLWGKRPMRFGDTHRSAIRRSSSIKLVLRANLTRIHLTENGTAVESVEASTLEGKRLSIRAKVYVLACGGLENARLLLAASDRHPGGIGNQYGVVGRYFMDHPRAVFGRVRLRRGCVLPLLRGSALRDGKVQFGMSAAPEVQRRRGLLNHYATLESEFSGYAAGGYQSLVKTMKVLLRKGHAGSRWSVGRAGLGDIPGLIYLLTPKELMPHVVYRWHTRLRNARHSRLRDANAVVVYFCEQPPDAESRVTLSRERDRLGISRLVLDWKLGPEVTRSVLELQELLRAGLDRAGIGVLETGTELQFTDASHHMGTTRMSDDPRTGVVDTDCKIHGLENLYVSGSSVFPSAGHANPTLTIVALALRLAQQLRAAYG